MRSLTASEDQKVERFTATLPGEVCEIVANRIPRNHPSFSKVSLCLFEAQRRSINESCKHSVCETWHRIGLDNHCWNATQCSHQKRRPRRVSANSNHHVRLESFQDPSCRDKTHRKAL